MHIRVSKNLGQTILEYSLFVGIVAVVAVMMAPMLRRAVQSVVKTTADQIGRQEDSEQTFVEGAGHLINQVVRTHTNSTKETRQHPDYETQYIYTDAVTTNTTTESNLGFTEEN